MTQLLVLPVPAIPVHHRQNFPYRSMINITDRKFTSVLSSKTMDSLPTNHNCEREDLQKDFEPGPFDVICSQGKTAKTHPGNIHFQSVIHKRAKEYSSAIEKRNKSKIVRNIIETIRKRSSNGGFIKKGGDGRWRVVGLEQAREKVSQSLRDVLADRYRSSLSAKKRSRTESNLKRMIDFDEIIGTNRFVSERMRWICGTLKKVNDSSKVSSLSDSDILKLMNETNTCILRQLKLDKTVQQKVRADKSQQQESNSDNQIISLPPSRNTVDGALIRFQTDGDFMM